jgi:hypothetical protein
MLLHGIGDTHFADYKTDWNLICGEDKDKILHGRYCMNYTENFKYVTCAKCRKLKEERDSLLNKI